MFNKLKIFGPGEARPKLVIERFPDATFAIAKIDERCHLTRENAEAIADFLTDPASVPPRSTHPVIPYGDLQRAMRSGLEEVERNIDREIEAHGMAWEDNPNAVAEVVRLTDIANRLRKGIEFTVVEDDDLDEEEIADDEAVTYASAKRARRAAKDKLSNLRR